MNEAATGERYLDGARFEGWVRDAVPGESVVYCRGDRLVPEAASIPAAFAQAGLVDLVQRHADGKLLYIAQRRSARYSEVSRPVRRVSSPGTSPARRAVERQLFKILCRTAHHNLPCPSNAALARLCGLSGGVAASYRLRRLVAAGLITVEQVDPTRPRIVTIVASGKATKGGVM